MHSDTPALKHGTAMLSPSRRGFLIAMIGSGALLGFPRFASAEFALPPVAPTDPALVPDQIFEPTIWYHIDRGGVVTVNIVRAEMGQHVGTALARIVADELEADWANVRIVHVDSGPDWGYMVTGGSWSIWQSFPVLSRAGAAGRIALIDEGAKLLGVNPEACIARNGVVTAGAKSITYGEIVAQGDIARRYTADQLQNIGVKDPSERRLIGRNSIALDIVPKTNGKARYGLDAWVEGMIYARPKVPPTRNDSTVVSIDDSDARSVPGYIRSLALDDPSSTAPGWVMIYADSFVAADRAADLVKVEWRSGAAAQVSEQDVQHHATQLIADPALGALVVDDPGVDGAFSAAERTLERTYTTSTVMHFALEPINALSFEKDGLFEVHTGNQWQSLILPVLAKALGRDESTIVLRTYMLGGGFGRRLNGDYAVPAALAAKAVRRPVKMVCTRPDDMRFDSPRSPSVQVLRMALSERNAVTAMEHHAAAGWPTAVMAPTSLARGANGIPYDPFAINGANHWYTVGAQRVRALRNDLADRSFRPGWLRAVGPGWTNWALESFIDEAAQAAGVDAVTFRLSLLDGAGRNAGSAPNAVGGARRQ